MVSRLGWLAGQKVLVGLRWHQPIASTYERPTDFHRSTFRGLDATISENSGLYVYFGTKQTRGNYRETSRPDLPRFKNAVVPFPHPTRNNCATYLWRTPQPRRTFIGHLCPESRAICDAVDRGERVKATPLTLLLFTPNPLSQLRRERQGINGRGVACGLVKRREAIIFCKNIAGTRSALRLRPRSGDAKTNLRLRKNHGQRSTVASGNSERTSLAAKLLRAVFCCLNAWHRKDFSPMKNAGLSCGKVSIEGRTNITNCTVSARSATPERTCAITSSNCKTAGVITN